MSEGNILPVDFSKLPQGLNTATEKLRANIAVNIRRRLPQLAVHTPQDREMCIVAGGPSLNDTWDDLQVLIAGGAGVLAVNGAYGYMVDRGFSPPLMALMDAREWNKRFVENPQTNTKFFIASQCDPAVFDALADNEVFIWHAPIPIMDGENPDEWLEGRALYRDYYFSDKNYLIAPGGVTCTAKTIMLTYWLGFRKIHMFGFDSCWMDGKDHAYDQPENCDKNIKFRLAERWFNCAPWMAYQADSFFKMVPHLPDNLELQVHGDGLIAYGLEHSAEIWEHKEMANAD